MIQIPIDKTKLPYLDAQEVKYDVVEKETFIPALVVIVLEGTERNIMDFGHAMMHYGRERALAKCEVDRL